MSAFNDYCIGCEQLINSKTHGELYCSETCRLNDNIVVGRNVPTSNSESLIKTPALQPVDQYMDDDESECDIDFEIDIGNDVGLFQLDYKCMYPNSGINSKDYSNKVLDDISKDVIGINDLDHAAENNYKIWLSYALS